MDTSLGENETTKKLRGLLPNWQSVLAWLAFTMGAVMLDGWTGLVVGVAIAAALLAGAGPRSLAAAGVVCFALVPVWILSRGSATAEDVTPAWVNDSLVPHHLAFAALSLIVVSVVLQSGSIPDLEVVDRTPLRTAGPLGGAGLLARWMVVAVGALAAVAVCVAASQA
ncbi:MAG: hypothetical protein ABI239_05480 [Aquihabitans sp.]